MNLFHLYKADFLVELNSTLQNRLVRRGMSKPHKDYLGHIFARCEISSHPLTSKNLISKAGHLEHGGQIQVAQQYYSPSTNILKLESLRKIGRGWKIVTRESTHAQKLIIYEENNF
jgi:hypothetical protein